MECAAKRERFMVFAKGDSPSGKLIAKQNEYRNLLSYIPTSSLKYLQDFNCISGCWIISRVTRKARLLRFALG